MLLLDKLVGRYLPMRFVAFSLVGGAGVFVHMTIIALLLGQTRLSFPAAQTLAAALTMVFNYSVNNVLTYRDQRRRRLAWFTGLLSFMVACSVGGFANVGIAAYLFSKGAPWMLASFVGILLGSVWNYATTSRYTWAKPGRANA
jgi:dolichol-phosphate mannosyltransferase